ncbi:MAG: PAS domain S-box protein [Smithella sp.]
MGHCSLRLDAENRAKQRQAEEKLQSREAQFESIVTTSQEWIWSVDPHGVHTFSNAAIEKILGFTAEEIVKLGAARDMVFEEDSPLLTGTLARAIEQKKDWSNLVIRWKHRDGTLRYLESSAVPIFDHAGNVQGFHGSNRDITERMKAEEMLRESEANYRQLFENSPAGIYRIDFKSGNFITANDVFCAYAGCTQEEITSLSPFDVLTEESQKLFLARLEKISQGVKVPETVEFEILNKKGKRSLVQLNIKNIYDAGGHIVGADVVDAMASHRPYRASLGIEEALQEIEKNKGILYDETVVNTCLKLFREKDYKLV